MVAKEQKQKGITWWQGLIWIILAIIFFVSFDFLLNTSDMDNSDRIDELESQIQKQQDKIDCLDEFIFELNLNGEIPDYYCY